MLELDDLVIGAGQAGVPLAGKLAAAGRRVGLAERKHLGGSCVNFGCTPSKAVHASAKLAYEARDLAGELGIRVGSVEADYPAVIRRARAVVQASVRALNAKFNPEDENPFLLRGHARFTGRAGDGFEVRITPMNGDGRQDAAVQTVRADRVVLDTGTRVKVPPIAGCDDVGFICPDTWLNEEILPGHLLLVGAGYIGLEMSQFYRRMGAKVTVVDPRQQVAIEQDKPLADELMGYLADEGVTFILGQKVERVDQAPPGLRAHLSDGRTIDADKLFLATGRKPNTDDLGLETIGLEPNEDGTIPIDERMQTPVENVYAVGDIRGGPMFTHTSHADNHVLESQFLGDGTYTYGHRIVPYAVFTDPEMGHVGLSETAAREAGFDVAVGRMPVKQNGRHYQVGQTRGTVQLVVDRQTRRLLGATCLCDGGGEIVHAAVDWMHSRATLDDIYHRTYIHPTYHEAIKSVADQLRKELNEQ